MLRLLLGRAGTGKTETCLRQALGALAAEGPDGPPLVLLAPEQATYQLERALLHRLPDGTALVRLEVLSFGRLARRILAEHGGLARPRLGEAGRRMILRSLLHKRRADLLAFGRSADRPGLARVLAEQFSEFEAYAVEPTALRTRASTAPPGTAERLHDLALLWEAYRERVVGHLAEPGSELAAAAAAGANSTFARARIWVDGFAGFTPREEGLLAAVLRGGADVTLALCLDGREWTAASPPEAEDPTHPFAPTLRTLRRLLAVWPDAELRILDAKGPAPRFRTSRTIARLEREIWEPRPPEVRPGTVAGIAVHASAFRDPQAEVDAAADEVDRLCREEGYRYREIAVVLRDMESYHPLVALAFAARGIPVFIDRKRPVGGHPVPRVLVAALRMIVEHWSLTSVRNYLHQDLCGLEPDQADRLENFAVAHALSGPCWYRRKQLHFPPPHVPDEVESAGRAERRTRDEHQLHSFRRRLAAAPRQLERDLGKGVNGALGAQACRDFLDAVRAAEETEASAAEAENGGHPEEAAWHRLCLQQTTTLLQQIELALAGTLLTPDELLAAVEAGLEDLTVGLVPPRIDQVLCGAVHRSRHPEIRAAFILGMGEGHFPPAPAESPLLGDADRLALRAAGIELAPTAEERLLAERYLGYIALTRASERLYLSYPEGAGASDLFRRAKEVASAVPWGQRPGPGARAGLAPLAAALALHLGAARDSGGPSEPEWAAAESWLLAAPERASFARAARKGIDRPPRASIGPELASRLYSTVFSATRLESAASCRFQHFARYGLGLAPRQESGVDPSHLGRLLHAALAQFVRGLIEDGRDWTAVDEQEAACRRMRALRGAEQYVLGHVPEGSARGPLLLRAADRDLARAVEALLLHARAGAYRPVAVEWEFESDGACGRIDRLDEAIAANGTRYVRVVDYKTGADDFSLQRFFHSLDLQPVLYLHAALGAAARTSSAAESSVGAAAPAGVRAAPGGFFLMPVRDEIASVDGPAAEPNRPSRLRGLAPADHEALALHERDLDGGVTGVRLTRTGIPYKNAPVAAAPDFALIDRALGRRVAALRAAVASGSVAADPYRFGGATPCAACDLRPVCRFDPAGGDRHRFLRGPQAVWEALKTEEGIAGA